MITLSEKKFFLIPNLNLPWCNWKRPQTIHPAAFLIWGKKTHPARARETILLASPQDWCTWLIKHGNANASSRQCHRSPCAPYGVTQAGASFPQLSLSNPWYGNTPPTNLSTIHLPCTCMKVCILQFTSVPRQNLNTHPMTWHPSQKDGSTSFVDPKVTPIS